MYVVHGQVVSTLQLEVCPAKLYANKYSHIGIYYRQGDGQIANGQTISSEFSYCLLIAIFKLRSIKNNPYLPFKITK